MSSDAARLGGTAGRPGEADLSAGVLAWYLGFGVVRELAGVQVRVGSGGGPDQGADRWQAAVGIDRPLRALEPTASVTASVVGGLVAALLGAAIAQAAWA